jgi:hypothetical protein
VASEFVRIATSTAFHTDQRGCASFPGKKREFERLLAAVMIGRRAMATCAAFRAPSRADRTTVAWRSSGGVCRREHRVYRVALADPLEKGAMLLTPAPKGAAQRRELRRRRTASALIGDRRFTVQKVEDSRLTDAGSSSVTSRS